MQFPQHYNFGRARLRRANISLYARPQWERRILAKMPGARARRRLFSIENSNEQVSSYPAHTNLSLSSSIENFAKGALGVRADVKACYTMLPPLRQSCFSRAARARLLQHHTSRPWTSSRNEWLAKSRRRIRLPIRNESQVGRDRPRGPRHDRRISFSVSTYFGNIRLVLNTRTK